MISKLLIIAILIFTLVGCNKGTGIGFVEYTPLKRVVINGDHKIEIDSKLNSKEHHKRVVKIFDKYGVDYKIVGDFDRILIPKSLSNDKDLLANYTSKAEF